MSQFDYGIFGFFSISSTSRSIVASKHYRIAATYR